MVHSVSEARSSVLRRGEEFQPAVVIKIHDAVVPDGSDIRLKQIIDVIVDQADLGTDLAVDSRAFLFSMRGRHTAKEQNQNQKD